MNTTFLTQHHKIFNPPKPSGPKPSNTGRTTQNQNLTSILPTTSILPKVKKLPELKRVPRKLIPETKFESNLNQTDDYFINENTYIKEVSKIFDELNNNNIKDFFDNLIMIKSSGSSETVIIKATLGKKFPNIHKEFSDIIIKASFCPLNDNYENFDNSLEVERQIYKYVISDMTKYTPFLLTAIKILNIKNELNEPNKPTKLPNFDKSNLFTEFISKIDSDIISHRLNNNFNLLITKKSKSKNNKGITLYESLVYINEQLKEKNIFHLEGALFSLMFQILWTLEVFNRYNFKHNDLHANNIFVEQLNNPVILTFRLDNTGENKVPYKYIKLTSHYIIKIFDFDISTIVSHSKVDRNIKLDDYFCKRNGQCNYVSKKFDLFSILINFKLIIEENCKFKTEFLDKIINVNMSEYQYSKKNNRYPHLLKYDTFPIDMDLKYPIHCLNELINIKWDEYEYEYNPIKIVFDINDTNVRYILPEQIKVPYFYPFNHIDYPNTILSEEKEKLLKLIIEKNQKEKEKNISFYNKIIKEVNFCINQLNILEGPKLSPNHILNLWDKEFKVNGYDWKNTAADLLYSFLRKDTNLEKFRDIIMAGLLLTSSIYYKLPINKLDILLYDHINLILKSLNNDGEIKLAINLIWEILSKTKIKLEFLPVLIPNFNMDFSKELKTKD